MNYPKKEALSPESPLPVITIRKMTDTDIHTYCMLFKNVFSNNPWNEHWTISAIDTAVKRIMRKKGFFGMVAEAAPDNVGYLTGFRLGMIHSVFYMDQLFVDGNYQGNKIGKRLLSETTHHLKGLGVSRIVLLTKPNSAAEGFYKADGYKRFLPVIQINGKGIFHTKV